MKIYVIILGLIMAGCASSGIQNSGEQLDRILQKTKPKSLERENQLSQLCLNPAELLLEDALSSFVYKIFFCWLLAEVWVFLTS